MKNIIKQKKIIKDIYCLRAGVKSSDAMTDDIIPVLFQ